VTCNISCDTSVTVLVASVTRVDGVYLSSGYMSLIGDMLTCISLSLLAILANCISLSVNIQMSRSYVYHI
jgi:hypothetical protein